MLTLIKISGETEIRWVCGGWPTRLLSGNGIPSDINQIAACCRAAGRRAGKQAGQLEWNAVYILRGREGETAALATTPPETDEWVSALPVPVFICPKTLKRTLAGEPEI